jgi:hypothetical protein
MEPAVDNVVEPPVETIEEPPKKKRLLSDK